VFDWSISCRRSGDTRKSTGMNEYTAARSG
jgi:hypothetical protein